MVIGTPRETRRRAQADDAHPGASARRGFAPEELSQSHPAHSGQAPERCQPARRVHEHARARARSHVRSLDAHLAALLDSPAEARLLPVDGVLARAPARGRPGQPGHARRNARGARRARHRALEIRSSKSTTRASATAAWGASRRAFSIRWRRSASPAWATACATTTASSARTSSAARRSRPRTTGCAFGNPWEVARPERMYEVHFGGRVIQYTGELRALRARVGRHARSAGDGLRHPGARLPQRRRQHAPALVGQGDQRVRHLTTSIAATTSRASNARATPRTSRACSTRTTSSSPARSCG